MQTDQGREPSSLVYIHGDLGNCYAFSGIGTKTQYFNICRCAVVQVYNEYVQIYEFGTEKLNRARS